MATNWDSAARRSTSVLGHQSAFTIAVARDAVLSPNKTGAATHRA
jgi:hypothetical protein